MRSTLDLPDELFRELKSLAAQRGVTVKLLLRAAVEREIRSAGQGVRKHKVRFPVLDSKEPGTLDMTNAELESHLT